MNGSTSWVSLAVRLLGFAIALIGPLLVAFGIVEWGSPGMLFVIGILVMLIGFFVHVPNGRPALYVIAGGSLGLFLCLVTIVAWRIIPRSPFSANELDAYAEAVVKLDRERRFKRAINPQESIAMEMALKLADMRASALDIWADLLPLLQLTGPNSIQFRKMESHVSDLAVLASVSDSDTEQTFLKLEAKVIGWRVGGPRRALEKETLP